MFFYAGKRACHAEVKIESSLVRSVLGVVVLTAGVCLEGVGGLFLADQAVLAANFTESGRVLI